MNDSEVIALTERLALRRWRESDLEPFFRINSDSRVMEFLPETLTREKSDELARRIASHFEKHGFGLCAAELRTNKKFIGYVGLAVPSFETRFTPCVEIGWRLDANCWARGLATEAARRIVRYAFGPLGLKELVSFTSPANVRSRRVMEKTGMRRDPADDFDHPNLPAGNPLRRQVLYRLSRVDWEAMECSKSEDQAARGT